MSLRCAAAVIQAEGFAGMPPVLQWLRAAAKASCIASSARSKDRETRIRLAIMRPDSRRKIDSTVARSSSICGGRPANLANGADLNTARLALACSRNSCGPFQCFVEIFAIEDIVSGQLLFRFR